MLKSKAILKKPIDWTKTIKIAELKIDPAVFEIHKKRIWETFTNATEEIKQKQLENLVLRDNMFNEAMQFIVESFEFELDEEEKKQYAEDVIKNFGQSKKEVADIIADKMIQKILVFDYLQKEFKIEITDEEFKKIVDDFYKATNKSVRRFYEDPEENKKAKANLIEEKTMAFILSRFPKDISELQENIKKAQQDAMEKQAAKNNSEPKTENKPN